MLLSIRTASVLFVCLVYVTPKPIQNQNSQNVLRDLLIAAAKYENRMKRFVLGSKGGWTTSHLTYFVANTSRTISQEAVEKDLSEAFDLWSAHSGITFEKTLDSLADISISFERGSHGDSFSFSHPPVEAAHTFLPKTWGSLSGNIHFNDDVTFSESSNPPNNTFNFFNVALHEIGHSLGLAHSADPESIMYPYAKKQRRSQLSQDDVLGLQQLYF